MKVLGIVGSPRLHGNTEMLVQMSLAKAQKGGAEIELVTLAKKAIAPCDACYSCHKTGKCHLKDDMQDIYAKLLEADGIIFGTPVYYYSVTAQAKALIDRCFVFSVNHELRNKAAGVVVTKNRTGSTGALAVFNGFFTLEQMIMVGRATGIGNREKGRIKEDDRAINQAEALGETIVEYIQSRQIPLIYDPYSVKRE
jgi:multimeric flavodoxin WrbA